MKSEEFTMGRFIRVFSTAVLSISIIATGIVLPSTANALSEYNIKLTSNILRAGMTTNVVVESLYSTKKCTLRFIGPSKTKAVSGNVRNSGISMKIRVPQSIGEYRLRANCGKDGTATSASVMVIARNSPDKAGCDVVESGFTVTGSDGTSVMFGAVVRNSSQELSASEVTLAVTLRDSAGNVVKTDSVSAEDISPGSQVYVGTSIGVGSRAISATVVSKCATTLTKPITGVISAGTADPLDSDGDTQARGQFVNTQQIVVDQYSTVEVILRNSAGAIIGGVRTRLDSFVLPGATSTWTAGLCCFFGLTQVPSVEAMVFPEED